MINYNKKKFKVVTNTEQGDVSENMVFSYEQDENIITCQYSGDNIKSGHLIGIVDTNSHIRMLYHQVDGKGKLKSGKCHSKPIILPSGKIQLHETWEWILGDKGKGISIIEEI